MEASSHILFAFYWQPQPSVNYIGSRSRELLGHSPDDYCRDSTLLFSQIYPRDCSAFEETYRQLLDSISMTIGFVRPDDSCDVRRVFLARINDF